MTKYPEYSAQTFGVADVSFVPTRGEMEELVPNLKFQQRRKWANLFEDKEVRERSNRSYPKPDADGPWLDAEIGGDDRLDSGLPNDDAYSFAEGMASGGPDAPAATGGNATEVSNHLDLEIDEDADDTGDIDFSNVPDLDDEEHTAGAAFGRQADDHIVDIDDEDDD